MKLLWFSHIIPFPPRGGNLQRTFNLIRQSSRAFEIHLVAFNQQGYSQRELSDYLKELRKYCASVEFWELPYRWRSALWWLRLLWSPLWRDPYACRAVWSTELAARWKRILQTHPDALLHFDSSDLALYAPPLGFRKVLNHHNCESAMARRRAEVEPNFIKKSFHRMNAGKLARLERDLCNSFQVNVVVSDLDAQVLRAGSPNSHFHLVENGTDTDYFQPMDIEEVPQSIVFAGSLDWYPNVSGIEYFVRDIWPLLKRQCPDVRLLLAGKNPAPSIIRRAKADPAITVEANPDDIRPWLARGSVFICPILDGGGTRLKLLDAMAMGKPIVSTTIGCEGLRIKPAEHMVVADTAGDFAGEVSHLLKDQPSRRKLGDAGRALVEAQYSWKKIGEHLQEAYQCAMNPESCALRAREGRAPNGGSLVGRHAAR